MIFHRYLPAIGGLALCVLTGCQAFRPARPHAFASIAAAAHTPIVFRADPGLLDAPTNAADVLTLPATIRLVAERDARIQAALARVRIAEADSDQAGLLPNPVLDIALQFPTSGGKAVIEAGLAAELLTLLQRPGRITAADSRLRVASADAVGLVLDVFAETKKSYATVQSLDALAAVQQDRSVTLERLLKVVRARFEAGEATQFDVTTLEAQQLELEAEIADKSAERREERLHLSHLIGNPSGSADWPLTRWDAEAELPVAEKQWVEAALQHRPEVIAATNELTALGAEQSLTRFSPFDSAAVGISAQRDPDWRVGPSLSAPIPIFDTGQAKRDRASAAVVEARYKLQESQREAVEETRRAYASFESSKQNLERVRDKLIPLQQRRLTLAEAQYRAGAIDITSLFLAEQDLQSARARLIELQRRLTESLIRLERAAGRSPASVQK